MSLYQCLDLKVCNYWGSWSLEFQPFALVSVAILPQNNRFWNLLNTNFTTLKVLFSMICQKNFWIMFQCIEMNEWIGVRENLIYTQFKVSFYLQIINEVKDQVEDLVHEMLFSLMIFFFFCYRLHKLIKFSKIQPVMTFNMVTVFSIKSHLDLTGR